MKDADVASAIKQIAKLEAKGETQEAGDLKQELFTNGMDYPEIEAAVERASKSRAKNPDGQFKADDPKTPDKNEAFETGKKPKPKAKTKK